MTYILKTLTSVNDDYSRMVCCRMVCYSDYRMSPTAQATLPVMAGLPHKEKFAFINNYTGCNSIVF